MTHFIGFGSASRQVTLTTVEKQVTCLVDLMTDLRVGKDRDLAMVAGYDSEAMNKLTQYQDDMRVRDALLRDVEQSVKQCTDFHEAMGEIEARRSNNTLDELSRQVAEQERIASLRVMDRMKNRWGSEWLTKLNEALRRSEEPSHFPSEEANNRRDEFEAIMVENRSLRAVNARLAGELQATRSILATRPDESVDKNLKRRLRAQAVKLKQKNSSLSRSLAQCKARLENCEEKLSCFSASLHLLEQLTGTVPREAKDWEFVLRYESEWPARLAAGVEVIGWHWLEPWSDELPRVDMERIRRLDANRVLIELGFALRDDDFPASKYETIALLQQAASNLASSVDVQEGLCRMIVDIIYKQAAPETHVALLLCQILDTISKRWPAIGADTIVFLSNIMGDLSDSDIALIEAVLSGWQGNPWDGIPMCACAVTNERLHGVVAIKSINMCLSIHHEDGELRWIGPDRIDYDNIVRIMLKSTDRSGDTSLLRPSRKVVGTLFAVKGYISEDSEDWIDSSLEDSWEGFSN